MADKIVLAFNPPLLSKINWTQAIAILAMALSFFGVDLDPDTQVQVLAVIIGIQGVATWIFRTWFTGAPPTTLEIEVAAADKGLVAVPPDDVKDSAKPVEVVVKKNFGPQPK